MRVPYSATILTLIYAAILSAAAPAHADVAEMLRNVPGDFPITIVLPDVQRLSTSIAAAQKRFDSSAQGDGILAQVKSSLGLSDWIDFSKPIVLAMPSLGGESEACVWAHVPGFAEKVKALEGATLEEGLWHLPIGLDENGEGGLYAKVQGDFVIGAPTKALIERATSGGPSLADVMKSNLSMLGGRDVLIHMNIEPVRAAALGGLAQFAQMAPMMAMMVAQQRGMDPMAMTTAVSGIGEALTGFLEQLQYVDILFGVDDQGAKLTLATGFNDGPIKTYLSQQKPGTANLFAQLAEQAFVVAFASDVPGDGAPFFDYMIPKTLGGAQGAPGTRQGNAGVENEAVSLARDLYRSLQGMSTIIGGSHGGLRIVGVCAGKDPTRISTLLKKSMEVSGKSFPGLGIGVSYEAAGSKRIGSVDVDEFRVKVDTTNPAGATALALYGADPRFLVGIVNDRVRFCMSSEQNVGDAFAAKIARPFAAQQFVKESLAALPSRRNAVMLLDPVGFFPMIGASPAMPEAAPGPPIAVSVTLSGEPARVDIHVPLSTIERVMKAAEEIRDRS